MAVDVRKGQGDVKLTREEFERRVRERFYDPEFERVSAQIADVVRPMPIKNAAPDKQMNAISNEYSIRSCACSDRQKTTR